MRVLHTVNSIRAAHGGPSRSVPGLVGALREGSLDARLHVADRDGRLDSSEGVDLVHDHGLWLPSNHFATRFARRAGCPLVISPRGMLEPWALSHRAWKKRLAWLLYQRADLASAALLHATSETEVASIHAAGVKAPVAIIPNGIVLPEALPPRTSGTRRRALFLSRLHPVKGVSMLLSAWEQVRPAGWELVLAGPEDGGHGADLRAQVAAAGLDGAVTFHGPVDDDNKWALYRSADLFVLTTYSENFGLVVAEALAAGLPVLTTTGAPWEVLARQRSGWWVSPNIDAVARALAEATALDSDRLRAMGERGQAYAHDTFGWLAIARAMLEAYRWVLGRSDRPSFVYLNGH